MRTSSLRDRPKNLLEMLEREDSEVTCLVCEKKDRQTFEAASVVSGTTHGVSAVVVGIPWFSIDVAWEEDPVVKVAIQHAKKIDEGINANTYHEGSVTKAEFERSNGIFELMIELPRNSVGRRSSQIDWSRQSEVSAEKAKLEPVSVVVSARNHDQMRSDQTPKERTLGQRPTIPREQERTLRKDELRRQVNDDKAPGLVLGAD